MMIQSVSKATKHLTRVRTQKHGLN